MASSWVLLAYRLPGEPSTPRVSVWRAARRLGALQLGDGVVALPETPETIDAFESLAEDVVKAGGEASTWQAAPRSKEQHGQMVQEINSSLTAEYHALVAAAEAATDGARPQIAQRLQRELSRIKSRDHLGAPGCEEATHAVARLETNNSSTPGAAADRR